MKRNSGEAVVEHPDASMAPPLVLGPANARTARLSSLPVSWGPAANVDHFITRPCDIAEWLGEEFRIGGRLAGYQDEAAATSQGGNNSTSQRLVVRFARKIIRAGSTAANAEEKG